MTFVQTPALALPPDARDRRDPIEAGRFVALKSPRPR
jgi:hypothetical protein